MFGVIKIKLQELADEKGVTLYRVSEDTGIGYSTLHKFKENKVKMINLEYLEILCNYFDCKPDKLLTIED
jgi:DNA-binding Xre family transcriptional regulator